MERAQKEPGYALAQELSIEGDLCSAANAAAHSPGTEKISLANCQVESGETSPVFFAGWLLGPSSLRRRPEEQAGKAGTGKVLCGEQQPCSTGCSL